MSWAVSTLTMAGLALIGYSLWLAWPPLAFALGGTVLLRVSWSFDDGGES
jgi:hypothetical protein